LRTGQREQKSPHKAGFYWCQVARNRHRPTDSGAGDRRTVVGREGAVFAGLEFGGFFGVPQRVSIKKSASYGFQWNRIGNCGGSSHPLQMVPKERQKRPIADTHSSKKLGTAHDLLIQQGPVGSCKPDDRPLSTRSCPSCRAAYGLRLSLRSIKPKAIHSAVTISKRN